MSEIRAGIIGTGRAEGPGRFAGIARFHLNGYRNNPHVRLAGFYDAIPANARGWAEQYGVSDVPVYENLDDLLASVDVVSICTPNSSHVELSLRALRAGVAVLCEKPIGLSYAEARAAAQLAAATGQIHMVNFSLRRAPGVRYLKELIGSGRLGQLYWGRVLYTADRHAEAAAGYEWRFSRSVSGHGALADMAVHGIDLIRYLLGEAGEFAAVSGALNTFVKQRRTPAGEMAEVTNDDVALFTGELAGGGVVSITGSRVGFGGWMLLELAGSGGGIRWNGGAPEQVELRLKPDGGAYQGSWETVPVPAPYQLDRPVVFAANPVESAVDEIVAARLQGRPASPDFSAGAAAQRVVDAVAEAAATGRRIAVAAIG